MGFCYNGGTHDGIKCLCTPIFYGPSCEFSTESFNTNLPFPGTILAHADLEVTVTNFNFTEDLLDITSEAYGAFEDLFHKEMMRIYGSIPGYEGVKIETLRRGSIVVTYEVFFTLVASNNVSQDVEDITHGLVLTLKEVEDGQGACQNETDILCLKVAENPLIGNVTETSDLDGETLPGPHHHPWTRQVHGCNSFILISTSSSSSHTVSVSIPSYFADTTGGSVSCITTCTPNRPTSLQCHHGQCRVTLQGSSCL
ncbi:mucin-3B-like [Melopsittacus undulatus]|uniref:mucin-3B-like n=1 Tax=Melopsittacus undulatus TaxID=13146 RepID=UPI00146DC2DB|nr:mucin-3B-like [Melopsittacus undulatus]